MTLLIRGLAQGDRERWNELWQGYLTFYREDVPKEITDVTWLRLLTPDGGIDGVVAVDETGDIVGFAHFLFHRSTWAEGGYCYLEDLFVDPNRRGHGAGRALIAAVGQAAREKGCERMYLATQEFNTTARALYDKVMTLSPFVQYRVDLK